MYKPYASTSFSLIDCAQNTSPHGHLNHEGLTKNIIVSGSACRVQYCSCTSFVVGSRVDAQFCENCGHARSLHG